MAAEAKLRIDRERSSKRIEQDVDTLAELNYTLSSKAICRYAYTPVYRNTLTYFQQAWEALKFETYEDPIGNFVARNRPQGEKVFGLGSHCDSNRNGGKYDGTLGVVTALEVCRLNEELGLDLPLQVISFLEEEGSGFGVTLLGSRICARRIDEEELKETIRAIDDGRSFWEHATESGHAPDRWRECARIFDDLTGWIELHIEQGRVLQDTANRIGIVTSIAGYFHGDLTFFGRADHAGATPMGFRADAAVAAAECVIELERLARSAGHHTVGTVGEIMLEPGILNVVPGQARVSLDIRGEEDETVERVVADLHAFAREAAANRKLRVEVTERASTHTTRMDARVIAALERAAHESGETYMRMVTGAGHDTMYVAAFAPAGMVFVPCTDGISHSPDEYADAADAAIATEIILNAVRDLIDSSETDGNESGANMS